VQHFQGIPQLIYTPTVRQSNQQFWQLASKFSNRALPQADKSKA
jgi:hypothetical protein